MVGWLVTPIQILLLMPMTVVNLASLVITIFVILNATLGSFESHPTQVKTLAVATHYLDEDEATGRKDCAVYMSVATRWAWINARHLMC